MNIWVRDHVVGSVSEFLSEASFWLPDQTPPSAWLGHAPFAFWLMDVLKPRLVVELGVHSGFSYLTFCQAAQSLKLDCSCRGIDTWCGDEHAGFYTDDVYEKLTADHAPHKKFSRLIQSTFDEARSQFSDGSIDLLHIDGRHNYSDVRTDFETWRPKLSRHAIVLFHDTNVSSFGVKALWNEIKEDYPHFEFHHAHGLGVLGFGSDIPLKLRQLFGVSDIPEISRAVRSVYERLGNSIADNRKIADLERAKDAYRVSLSWKVTAPLRAVANLVRAVGRTLR